MDDGLRGVIAVATTLLARVRWRIARAMHIVENAGQQACFRTARLVMFALLVFDEQGMDFFPDVAVENRRVLTGVGVLLVTKVIGLLDPYIELSELKNSISSNNVGTVDLQEPCVAPARSHVACHRHSNDTCPRRQRLVLPQTWDCLLRPELRLRALPA